MNRYRKTRRNDDSARSSRTSRISSRRETLAKGMRDPWAGIGGTARGPARSGNPRGLVLALGIAVAVASAGLFHVWTRSEHLRLAYAIVEAEARAQVAEAEQARLNVESASLSSPIRVTRIATERLGLQAPDPKQVVDLRGDGVRDGDSGPAIAANALARR